jgi:hypothetical protein
VSERKAWRLAATGDVLNLRFIALRRQAQERCPAMTADSLLARAFLTCT